MILYCVCIRKCLIYGIGTYPLFTKRRTVFCHAAEIVGVLILMVVSPDISTFESLLGVGMVIVGIACTALMLISGKERGWGRFNKNRFQGYAYYYGAFAADVPTAPEDDHAEAPVDDNAYEEPEELAEIVSDILGSDIPIISGTDEYQIYQATMKYFENVRNHRQAV